MSPIIHFLRVRVKRICLLVFLATPAMAAPALELAVAASLAATPEAAIPFASAAPQLTWMSQDDWQTVVTRRELVAEQKVERKAQGRPVKVPKAERKSSWQSSNLAGDCVKRLHTDERAAAAGFQDDWSAKAVRRAEHRTCPTCQIAPNLYRV